MKRLVFALPGNETSAGSLAAKLGADLGRIEFRTFPDGDSYVRIDSDVAGHDVVIVCTLDRADSKFFRLFLVAATSYEMGAARVGLVCPYLPYMRQDARFRKAEAISSVHFAGLISQTVDWLVTVDPHLHRYHSLSELFSIRAVPVHAAEWLASWIKKNVEKPVLVGPDEESEQWVAMVAGMVAAPHVILRKIRRGDREVEISPPEIDRQRGGTPVLVDDIISTGQTMAETIRQLVSMGTRPPVCIAVHAIFADNAYDALRAAGAGAIVTTNTISHPTNAIEIVGPVADAVRNILADPA